MFGTLMRLWAWYAGEQSSITDESGLAINDSLMSKPLEASEMAQLVNLYSNDLLSRQTVLEELQRGGVLDPDLVVGDEIERIEDDRQRSLEEQEQEANERLSQEIKRSEAMAEATPAESETEQVPSKKTEQEKTAQAAKVAQ
jgi:hypothetical protein